MDRLPNIARLNTVRNLLAVLSIAAMCGSGAALLMPRQATSTLPHGGPSEQTAADSPEAAEDIVYLGQLPERLRSLSETEATPAVFRPASLSQLAQESVPGAESAPAAGEQPVEAQVFEAISAEPVEEPAAVRPYDDANVQFEISEQTESATAQGLEVSKEAVICLQQSPATVSIPVNVTVNNGDVLGQLESLKRQVELLTKRLEASEAALAEARASAAAKPPQVTVRPAVPAAVPGSKSAVSARPVRPRVQRPVPPAGPVQIDYFPAAGTAADQPLLPPAPEAAPVSPPPAVPDPVLPLTPDAPVLPELVPSAAAEPAAAEPVAAEPAERAVPLVPAEPIQPQSSLPRAAGAAAAVSSSVPAVPARSAVVTRAVAPHSAPELRYENWTNPGVPQQAPAWGGTVSRTPVVSESVMKRAVTNVREGFEETFDRLPTPDLRAPEWMRSMFRRSTKAAAGSSRGVTSKPSAASAALGAERQGVIVRPASHLQPGPPRQGSGAAMGSGMPAQRAGVR